jgi:hypothetical protein
MAAVLGDPERCSICGGPPDVRTYSSVSPVSRAGAEFIRNEMGADVGEGSVYTCLSCTGKMSNVWERLAERSTPPKGEN